MRELACPKLRPWLLRLPWLPWLLELPEPSSARGDRYPGGWWGECGGWGWALVVAKAQRRDVFATDAADATAIVAALGAPIRARAVVLGEGVGAAQHVGVARAVVVPGQA